MASRYVLLTALLILGLALLPGTVRTAGGILEPPLVPTRFDDPPPDGCAPDDCSLREAIIDANETEGPGKIELPAGTFTLSIEGSDEDTPAIGDLDITSSLTLSGTGQDETTIDAGGIDRVLQVGHNFQTIEAEISDLTVRNGRARRPGRDSGNGGGVFVSGDTTATLLRVGVLDNMASAQGGGIYNEAGPRFGSLTLIESTISGNQEGTDHGGSIPGGGGIHNEGEATLISTTVSDNSAHATDGGISNIGDMVIVDSSVTGNTASIAGGIGNGGNLSLSNTIVSGNTANLGAGLEGVGTIEIIGSEFSDNVSEDEAGAIRFSGGVLVIVDSTFSGNAAGTNGGAILTRGSGSIHLTNATFSGNTAGGAGGGMYLASGTVQLTNVTVVENQSAPEAATTSGVAPISPPVEPPGPPPQGGAGIYVQIADVSLVNTFLAANSGGDNCSGAIVSLGHNLDDATSCGFGAPGDISGEDPLLGPLADNGGSTLTHALLSGSPAIDAGVDADCPDADQRGFGRPVDGDGDGEFACDIGAFEFDADVLPTPTPQPIPTSTPTATPSPTATPAPAGLPGDANCDGLVNAIDAALILQLSAGLVSQLPCLENADVNEDGEVISVDAALVLQAVAGLITLG